MKFERVYWLGMLSLAIGLGAAAAAATSSPGYSAQPEHGSTQYQQGQQQGPQQQGQQQQQGQPSGAPEMAAPSGAIGGAPKTDPAEEAAYKAIYDLKSSDTDKVVELGEQFIQKYPTSRYEESVYSRLTRAYFSKNETDKMFTAGDKAVALNPDDVDVLALVGWVIPHSYDPNDLDSERKLDKAERYTKHAVELLTNMQKPAGMTDEDFAKAKAGALSQAHSGLGLVYFRRGQSAQSVAELQQSTQIAPFPDPTDFFVMGVELMQLKKFDEAATAFEKCSEIPGGLQARCKGGIDQAKKAAASQPAAKP